MGRFHDKLEDAKRECSELNFCIGVCLPKCSTGSAPYHLCSEDGWTSWDAREDCSWVKVNKGNGLYLIFIELLIKFRGYILYNLPNVF